MEALPRPDVHLGHSTLDELKAKLNTNATGLTEVPALPEPGRFKVLLLVAMPKVGVLWESPGHRSSFLLGVGAENLGELCAAYRTAATLHATTGC